MTYNKENEILANDSISYEEKRNLRRRLDDERNLLYKKFKETWNFVTQYFDGRGTWEENMCRAVKLEKERKYDFIIARTNFYVGTITDATGLYVANMELNGFIIGERGKVKVETIGAGGYNIQRFHFRTLIKPVK